MHLAAKRNNYIFLSIFNCIKKHLTSKMHATKRMLETLDTHRGPSKE